MLQAFLLAIFSHMIVKMLADLQSDLFGPEVAAETFQKTEIEPEVTSPEASVNDEKNEKSPKKVYNQKKPNILDLLRRKRRKPRSRRNGRVDSESDRGKTQ